MSSYGRSRRNSKGGILAVLLTGVLALTGCSHGSGDDAARAAQRALAVEHRGRAAQHFDALDRLGRQYEGQQVEAIKPVLQAEWSRVNGGSITDPELSEWAQHISDGRRIAVRTR